MRQHLQLKWELTKAMQQKALEILDQKLHCGGPIYSAKTLGAFSIYEVVIAIAI